MTQRPKSIGATDTGIEVDRRGIHLPAGLTGAMSLFIDGQRVWSFSPEDTADAKDQVRTVRWPATLKAFLSGAAQFELRQVDPEVVLFDQLLTFGDGQGRISVVDKNGMRLAIEKTGQLRPTWGESDSARKSFVLDATEEILNLLISNDVDAFLAFGCLLGAVREGKLIAHDNDADIAYVAKSSEPAEVIMESYAIERLMLERGYTTMRMSGGSFKVMMPTPEGGKVGCDIFTGFFFGDTFYLMPAVGAKMERSTLLPQGTVELEGRSVPAPAKPEVLLEATYGPTWRVPDPAFKFHPPARVSRRLESWMRGERMHKKYWDKFYNLKSNSVATEPSPFAQWLAEREEDRGRLLDIGSGTGRDTLWLASQGFETHGCDYSRAGVRKSTDIAKAGGLDATFQVLNLYDLRQVLTSGAAFAHGQPFDILYARFLIHAMETVGRHNLWTLARTALRAKGGTLYLEWRTKRLAKHEFGEHYRQFVKPNVVQAELKERGFVIEHLETGRGLAVHNREDPQVCRIVARLE